MFGYRLIREADYAKLMAERVGLSADRVALLRELATLARDFGSKATMADLLTVRVNVLELEAAQRRHDETGLPATAPQIGRGTPLQNAALGAGVDMFSDVGDENADKLRAAGMLHDDDPFDLPPPAARDLVGG
jgi:hypothetical protein